MNTNGLYFAVIDNPSSLAKIATPLTTGGYVTRIRKAHLDAQQVSTPFESLEGRDVPAAFSFTLSSGVASGVIGSGVFSTPTGMDPAQSLQVLALTDLEVMVGGDRFDLTSPATATYANGVLVGVTAEAAGYSDTLDLSLGAVTVTTPDPFVSSGSVVYDAADTELTFTLDDRTGGAISFDVPWNQVDDSLASQSLSPMGFNLNIAGQKFTYGSASFTTAPTLLFEYGEFKGLSFALNTAAAGFAYSSISMSGLDVTAIQAGTGLPMLARAEKTVGTPVGFINLAPLGTQANAYTLTIKFKAADGTTFEQTYNIGANTSAADVTTLVLNSIPQASRTPGGPGEPPIYGAGWYVKPNAAGTGFSIYSYSPTSGQTWNYKPVSPYSSGNTTASAQGATAQPSVSETQSSPK
jgi:hypothetical protein